MLPAALRGLVLAGGDSRRMGRDKAALEIAGTTLLERSMLLLEQVVGEAYVSIRDSDAIRSSYTCIPDSLDLRGPAAGILSAHQRFPDSAWLVLACDMPSVSLRTLQDLLAERDPQASATCWEGAEGRPEPLCTIYEPATLAHFLRYIEAGANPSPRDLLAQSEFKTMQAPASGALLSANTPQEWQQLRDKHD